MALRGTKPVATEGRAKILLFARSGFGKTTFGVQWPQPYLIDTERGAVRPQYVDALNRAGGVRFESDQLDDIISEVNELLRSEHPYRTLVIDPLTVPYNLELDRSLVKEGDAFGRYKMKPDLKMKRLCAFLLRLDMNVIVTSHAKANWIVTKNAKGEDERSVDGHTFDCFGKLDYLFDLVIEGVIHPKTKARTAVVRKSRLTNFPEGLEFAFSYDAFADLYGRAILEREAKPVQMASDEQVKQLKELVEKAAIPAEKVDQWLSKAKAESFDDMTGETIDKCITYCRSLVAAASQTP